LAACRAEPPAEAPIDADTGDDAGAAALPDADINASLDPLGSDPAAPTSAGAEAPRFVGRWAAEAGRCETEPWIFTASELRTPAGSVCRFGEVRAVPGGYDVVARCTAEGPERDDRLELRFAESAGALLLESRTIAGTGLVSCES
jgi:hypothetical protein